jgi:hypothetical protein
MLLVLALSFVGVSLGGCFGAVQGISAGNGMVFFFFSRLVFLTLPLQSHSAPRSYLGGGADSFYQKVLNANGMYVFASGQVPDSALDQFGYIVNMMLRKRSDIRRRLQRDSIKVAVIGKVRIS